MKQYGFSPLRPELAGQIKPGDIIVAGKNFGCGSSRNRPRRSSKRWESMRDREILREDLLP